MYAVGGSVQDVLTFTYDAAGNQTSAVSTAGAYTLTYDAVHQVTHVDEPFSLGLTFSYDAFGNRVQVEDQFAVAVGTVPTEGPGLVSST
jgi:YD repeat-containing protein